MARYEKGRKGATRDRIVELASRRFRADGVDGVGIATLMAEAGLTNGGFYAHFSSKEALVKEAVVHALSVMPGASDDRPFDLAAFVDRYLSVEHRDHPETGCALAALAPDLARRPAASRAAFQDEGNDAFARIAAALPEPLDAAERRPRAFAIFAHLLGTLLMARFVTDSELSDAILARGRLDAIRLAGFAAPTTPRR